jgi:hypothetical protein
MSEEKKPAAPAKPAAKPAAAPKPPKKLIPRTALKAAAKPAAAVAAPVPAVEPAKEAPPAVTPATAAASAKARPARKPSRVDETVARHQAVLADALVKALAIRYDQPKVMKQEAAKPKKAEKPEKVAKPRKTKLVRDSYAMPEAEYAKIGEIKKRLAMQGAEAKKSEVLRGGVAVLAALNDAELKAVMARVERIKTGRPNKDVKK